MNIEDFDVPLREWISQAKVERQIRKRFASFLATFAGTERGERVYHSRITEMCSANGQSLEVSYLHLSQARVACRLSKCCVGA